jgi:hypothetical protein
MQRERVWKRGRGIGGGRGRDRGRNGVVKVRD